MLRTGEDASFRALRLSTRREGGASVEGLPTGYGRTNILRMRAFPSAWLDVGSIVPQSVGELSLAAECVAGEQDAAFLLTAADRLPCGHNALLVERLADPSVRLWYAERAVTNGCSRGMVGPHIERRLHEREHYAVTNPAQTLPSWDSDLTAQTLEDSSFCEFLGLTEEAQERGVAQWTQELSAALPEKFKGSLPTVEELERELGSAGDDVGEEA
jgi:hypothetical protein